LSANELVSELTATYQSNAEETDNRIWRHACQSQANKILIHSPDTDAYNIGLSLLNRDTKQYVIQLNVFHATERKFLYLNNLQIALENEPDLVPLPSHSISEILQVLFICTGCDFVSFIKLLGKVTILNNFYQYAEFIGYLYKTAK